MQANQEELKRGLGERHMRLIALGAAIGVGLFLGSANAIELAGPGILLSYLLGGAAIFIIMRALGEMAVHNPVAGSFSRYAQDYWARWRVSDRLELLVHVAGDLRRRNHRGRHLHGSLVSGCAAVDLALAALAAMGSVNLIAVRVYGEFEFWFAMIKVVTIVLIDLARFRRDPVRLRQPRRRHRHQQPVDARRLLPERCARAC